MTIKNIQPRPKGVYAQLWDGPQIVEEYTLLEEILLKYQGYSISNYNYALKALLNSMRRSHSFQKNALKRKIKQLQFEMEKMSNELISLNNKTEHKKKKLPYNP